MKKLALAGVLTMLSLSSFAYETKCMISASSYNNVNGIEPKEVLNFKYNGNLKASLDNEELRLGSIMSDDSTGAIIFESEDSNSSETVWFVIRTNKSFKLLIKDSVSLKTIRNYQGACSKKLSTKELRKIKAELQKKNEAYLKL